MTARGAGNITCHSSDQEQGFRGYRRVRDEIAVVDKTRPAPGFGTGIGCGGTSGESLSGYARGSNDRNTHPTRGILPGKRSREIMNRAIAMAASISSLLYCALGLTRQLIRILGATLNHHGKLTHVARGRGNG
jgi:hypothetical protein